MVAQIRHLQICLAFFTIVVERLLITFIHFWKNPQDLSIYKCFKIYKKQDNQNINWARGISQIPKVNTRKYRKCSVLGARNSLKYKDSIRETFWKNSHFFGFKSKSKRCNLMEIHFFLIWLVLFLDLEILDGSKVSTKSWGFFIT